MVSVPPRLEDTHVPDEWLSQQSGSAAIELEADYWGFDDLYRAVAAYLPKRYAVADIGCAEALHSWYFRDHAAYIGVDTWEGGARLCGGMSYATRYLTPNFREHVMDGRDYARRLRGLEVVRNMYAIVSAVPCPDLYMDVLKTFPNCATWYPGDSNVRFQGVHAKEIEGLFWKLTEERRRGWLLHSSVARFSKAS